MYEYTPKRNIKKAAILAAFTFIIAIILFLSAGLGHNLLLSPAIKQLIAVIFAAAGIFITSKYLVMKYVYVLSEREDGEFDFSVIQVSGSRKCTVALISLSNVEEIKKIEGKISPDEKKKYAEFYSYCVDIAPENAHLLIAKDGGKQIAIKIQPDEKLIGLIEKYISNEIIF